jgi:hypothetical protein
VIADAGPPSEKTGREKTSTAENEQREWPCYRTGHSLAVYHLMQPPRKAITLMPSTTRQRQCLSSYHPHRLKPTSERNRNRSHGRLRRAIYRSLIEPPSTPLLLSSVRHSIEKGTEGTPNRPNGVIFRYPAGARI